MPLIVTAKPDPESHGTADEAVHAPRGSSMFGIAAGGVSGAAMGFLAAGSFSIATAALAGVIAGLLIGWQAARLTEPKPPSA